MIRIEETEWSGCQCRNCYSTDNVLNVIMGNENNETVIALCGNCRKELINKLGESNGNNNKWIPISKKKPPYDKKVLLCNKNGEQMIGRRVNNWGEEMYARDGGLGSGYCFYVTHWMPLQKGIKGDD